MGFIVYDGKSSLDFDAVASAYETFDSPVRDVESVSVAGRNGDLLTDNKRYENVDITYQVMIRHNFIQNYSNFRDYLLSKIGYRRLEDTMHKEFYRMARIKDAIEPDVGRGEHVGTFDLKFDCKPQKFLISGDMAEEYTKNGVIFNSTQFDAKPLIRVYGTGELQIGDKTITISKASDYTDLDCDIQDAYKGLDNCNQNVTITGYDFPVLKPGETGIRLGKGITKVEITPRWWTL